MKYLKYLEALIHDIREMTEEEWEDSCEYEQEKFTEKEKESILRFLSKKGISTSFKYERCYFRISNKGQEIKFFIYSDKDEWYLVEIHTISHDRHGRVGDSVQHFKCDQLESVFELVNRYISDIPDKPGFNDKKILSMKRKKLMMEISAKLRELSNEELEKVKSRLSSDL